MKRFFNFFKYRTIRVDILTIFLSLIVFSSVFIISFTYSKTYKSIINFSQRMMVNVTKIIIDKLDCILSDMEQLSETGIGLFQNFIHVSLENKAMTSYMFEVLKFYPNVKAFYAATTDGKFIQVVNLGIENQSTYRSDRSRPLPIGAVYAIRFLDRTQPNPEEIWQYLNTDLQVVATDIVPHSDFCPQTRPWYQGVEKTRALYWTDIYLYNITNEMGISVATPAFNNKKELVAIIGVDLALSNLSDFLTEQKIGKHGRAFILNSKGMLIAEPKLDINDPQHVSREVVCAAYSNFMKNNKNEFSFSISNRNYLAAVTSFPVTFREKWIVEIIVPFSDILTDLLTTQHVVVLISLLILIISAILVAYFSKRISKPIVQLAEEIDKIKHLNFESETKIKSNIKEISQMSSSVSSMRAAIRSFGCYVPKEIVNQLILKGQEIALEGEKKEITIFFSDVAGFTSIAEKVPLEILMSALSEYFDNLSKIILSTHGTIDKFMGDNIMAFWGAPMDVPEHETKACLCALYCQAFISKFNEKRKAHNEPEFQTRIGIHCGAALIGNVGTKERMNYTIIGDAVNMAYRLQEQGKTYQCNIIISEDVCRKIGENFLVRPLDHISVRGRQRKVKIFELMAIKEGDPQIQARKEQIELSDMFTQAYEFYHENKFDKARHLFEVIKQKFPFDYPTQLYLERTKII